MSLKKRLKKKATTETNIKANKKFQGAIMQQISLIQKEKVLDSFFDIVNEPTADKMKK